MTEQRRTCDICTSYADGRNWVGGYLICNDVRCFSLAHLWKNHGKWRLKAHELAAVIEGGKLGAKYLTDIGNNKVTEEGFDPSQIHNISKLSKQEWVTFVAHIISGYREKLKVPNHTHENREKWALDEKEIPIAQYLVEVESKPIDYISPDSFRYLAPPEDIDDDIPF